MLTSLLPCPPQITSDRGRASELARVAQLQDDLEKRDAVIQRIEEENKKLQVWHGVVTACTILVCLAVYRWNVGRELNLEDL